MIASDVELSPLDSKVLNEVWQARRRQKLARYDMVVEAALDYHEAQVLQEADIIGVTLQWEDALRDAIKYAAESLEPAPAITDDELRAALDRIDAMEQAEALRTALQQEIGDSDGKVVSLQAHRYARQLAGR